MFCCDVKGGYKGFYAHNTISLTPKTVNDIHKRGGTILGSSRGGHDTTKIVDSIQDRGINQVYISFYLSEQIISHCILCRTPDI
jgi:6-phosphofructokinase